MKIKSNSCCFFKTLFTFILQIYKLAMGTFLLLFVPQNCEGQTCSMLELWQPVQTEYQMALYFNALTLAMFLWTYMWELKRERWCIQHLDNNKHIAADNLSGILQNRADLDEKLRSLNVHYIHSLHITGGICFINFVGSGYLIALRYLDISTITSYFSFMLLILMKLQSSYNVGKQSYHENIALSAYINQPLTFNTLAGLQYDEERGSALTYDSTTGYHYLHA